MKLYPVFLLQSILLPLVMSEHYATKTITFNKMHNNIEVLILNSIMLLLSLSLIILNVSAWKNTRNFYRGDDLRNIELLFFIIRRTSLIYVLIFSILSLLIAFIFFNIFISILPLGLFFWMISVFFDNISRRIMPPSILVLCSSGSESSILIRGLNQSIRQNFFGGLRISYLIDSKHSNLYDINNFYSIKMDNLRQVEGDDWEESVLELMKIVPLIIIDYRRASDAVKLEAKMIINNDLRHKTIFITPKYYDFDGGVFRDVCVVTSENALYDLASNMLRLFAL